ncbi:hypothetical protein NP233_g12977 [Leucocoprinus birnbaumii]|uniref:C2H2-type domain-containing protein n=1 Tax=Leucocoprinus birnbaumii TaxID=56174 RepID=A0AAD5VJ54_9AGAR|nr:hypothetical protein NP233_g12977 [Leucocoprinus birnbaumii]
MQIHRRSCVKTYLATYANAKVLLVRDEAGFFNSLCSCPISPQSYVRYTTLYNHIQKAQCHWIGPERFVREWLVPQSPHSPTTSLSSDSKSFTSAQENMVTATIVKEEQRDMAQPLLLPMGTSDLGTFDHPIDIDHSDDATSENPASRSITPSVTTEFIAETINELHFTNELTSLGLAIQSRLKSLVCIECGVLLKPSSVSHHIRKTHASANISFDSATFNAYLANTVSLIDDNFPPPPTTVVPAFAGLSLFRDSMQCHLCSKIYCDEPTLENHYRAAHGKQKPPLPLLVTAQRYDSQFHNSYFRVTEPVSADLPSGEDPINAIFQDMKNAIPKQDGATEDARLTTPWLMSTKWHIHIKCAPVDDLREYAAPPTEKEFPRLSSLVLKYYQVISDRYLAEASDLVLQILNTPHPEKTGIVNDPIHSHQNTSTLSKYTATISRLLAFIMRPKPKYPLDIPDDLQTEVTKLVQSIKCKDPDQQVIANVHAVLLYLWTNTWHRSQTNTTPKFLGTWGSGSWKTK